MSGTPNRLTQVVKPGEREPEPLEERSGRSRSSWPLTRGTSLCMTALLAITVAGPALVRELGSDLLPALLLPALIATLVARLVFESVDGASRRARLAAALCGAVGGALVMAAAALILGARLWPTVTLGPVVLGSLSLLAAGCVRDIEIRVRLASRRVYFVGAAERLRELRRELASSPEASLVGAAAAYAPVGAETLAAMIRDSRATVLVLDQDAAQAAPVVAAATLLGRGQMRVRDLLGYYESEFKKVPLTELTPAWFLFDRPARQRRSAAAAARRAIVRALAGLLLMLSAPLVGLLMLLVRISSPGPAIFRQPRVGRDGAVFTLVKLRTMTVADDSASWATDQGHRITVLGHVLRRYRLDELPQLWNVLRGELALVGPRPEQVAIVERLAQQIPFYEVRHTIRPGLTGWAQVNLGYSGSLEGTRAKLQRDLYYVKHRSLRLDLLILWLTLKAVFTDPR
jgi:lipopolysaccharide/colanic/teichoic acid biosynthesis glycosyltransferase